MNQQRPKKTVVMFSFASFLNDLGSDMISPIWPLFLTSVLGVNMTVLGFIDGLGEAVVSLSQAFSGRLSDKIRRRKVFVWLGYLFAACSRIGYAFARIWQFIIPFRILDRMGKVREAPRDAIIADISNHETRGKNFGLLEAMDSLGAVFGITICVLFAQKLGYRNLFLLAAIPSVLSVLLVVFFIKEKPDKEIKLHHGLNLSGLNRNFKLFLMLSALFALGSFTYSFLLIYAKTFGFPIAFVPVLYLIFTAAASAFSFPFGKLSDKIGRKNVLTIAYLIWALICLVLVLGQNYWMLVGSFVLYGLHKGALKPVQKTFVSELAPAEFRASALGGFQMVTGLCALPASFIAGVLWDAVSVYAPFYFSLGLTLLAIIMLFFIRERGEDHGKL